MRTKPTSAKKSKLLRRTRPYGDLSRMKKLMGVPLYSLSALRQPKPVSPMVSLQNV